MAVKLRCPACRQTFRWEGTFPNFCPLCSAAVGGGDNPVASPHISAGRTKALSQSAEQTYRSLEASSEGNAQQAADMLNVPVSEMSAMKVTNMETQLRAGDLATRMPDNDITRIMAQPAAAGLVGNVPATAQYFAEATPKTGPDARMGSKATMTIHDFHTRNAGAIVAQGEQPWSRKARGAA